LGRTPATAGNQKTWTISGWFKRGQLGVRQQLITVGAGGGTAYFYLNFNATDTLEVNTYDSNAGVAIWDLITTQVFRDPAAWYHIVVAADTTQGTASDRIKVYVNGNQITAFSTATYPTLNYDTRYNINLASYINSYIGASSFYDGETAELNSVDGYPTGVTSGTWAATNVSTIFGAYSIYNQWLPIRYAGTYGTNGFYLPFSGGTATSYAGSFNGSTQYLNVNSVTAVGTGDFTVEAFVYFNAVSLDEHFFQLNSATNSNWLLSLDQTTNKFRFNVRNDIGVDNADIYSSATAVAKQWYHIAGVVSGTTATLYVNGIALASATLSGARTGTGTTIYIGQNGATASRNLNGYLSNTRYVKGTAVYTANFIPPTTNLTNITNTILLTLQNATIVDNSSNGYMVVNNNTVVTSVQSPFLNPTVLTADSSGNANNWTPNNISLTAGSTYDSLTDVPTLTSTTVANYAVLNPLSKSPAGTLSNGNLLCSYAPASNNSTQMATMGVSSGKWYWEKLITSSSTTPCQAISGVASSADTNNYTNYLGFAAQGGWGYFGADGTSRLNGAGSAAYGASYTTGDTIGFAFDRDAGTLTCYKNNVSQGILVSGLTSGTYYPAISDGSGSGTLGIAINFGQQPFTYTAPTGFLPLNTFNIAAGTVTTSGTFTGNLSTDGPFVFLNGTPTAMTINGNAVTFGTQADKLANGFKVRSSSASYNASGSNTYVATTVGAVFKYEDAQGNP
jgi:hypothetical protein